MYVAEMSCSQLLLTVGLPCVVHAHQDQLTSYLNAATSPYQIPAIDMYTAT